MTRISELNYPAEWHPNFFFPIPCDEYVYPGEP
jgi:hypothetical protein